ncbi:MAG: SGNH/GDSL hydrolase family protein [Pseudomonadota bacterium]
MRTAKAALVACVCLLASEPALSEETNSKNILVFGDSITWGWNPVSPIVPTTRHAEQDRWPNVMSRSLGEDYNVVTEGLSGRTTNVDDENAPGLMNGAEYLDSALVSHEPLDLVIIMLGTNDTKTYLNRSAFEIGLGMGELVNIVQKGSNLGWYSYEETPTKVLVVSPPPLGDEIDPLAAEVFVGAHQKIEALPKVYAGIASTAGEHFFDASSVVDKEDVGVDGVHLTVEGNVNLGTALATEVKKILE